ncbi:ATP-dependent DNA helicase [Shewanella surugensis]|uniref:ATP-dependent DNA helicase n=1 Tax=Shewanella surugensis TaxID=212020 RepID=A0ABT0LAZ1_9GAMM|nr:ATP-dependent DNA helicase [Shewanella surugensis]MCL1124879.1 ATP-dependent DNA helicase [Shewanella surugensis]
MIEFIALTRQLAQRSAAVFSDTGVLAQHVQGYRIRQAQFDMTQAVSDALSHTEPLVVEAGTGVGKTFAYLVPALLSGQQVIISTGTKTLQEQLAYQDIPALLAMLKLTPKVALLKGRSNYLCQLRLSKQLGNPQFIVPEQLDDLLRIHQWAGKTLDGDFGGLTSVSESAKALDLVRSQKEDCSGQDCHYFDACFTRKARLRTLDAKIIVVNHHLFFADKLLQESTLKTLLPDADVVIFDEAHQLPDIALGYLGQQQSMAYLVRLLNQISHIQRSELGDSAQIARLAMAGFEALSIWQQEIRKLGVTDGRLLLSEKSLAQYSWELLTSIKHLRELLAKHGSRSYALDEQADKLTDFYQDLSAFFECHNTQLLYRIDFSQPDLRLTMAPMNIARECQKIFNAQTRWIFTSATLQMNQTLTLFCQSLGLMKAKQLLLGSPFNYQRQALFCVPRHLANVNNETAAVRQMRDICIQATNAAKGRTFVLFTSHRMLEKVAQALYGCVDYPMLVQGQDSKQGLLKKFRQLGHAVLLGTGAFWEGVDVKGKRLSCVIIERLPFVSPEDKVFRTRVESMSHQALDPFTSIALPQAIITLNQGVGRLIRDEKDHGVLILCDNRIVNRDYGRAFLHSLPPMSRTRDLNKALDFLSAIK